MFQRFKRLGVAAPSAHRPLPTLTHRRRIRGRRGGSRACRSSCPARGSRHPRTGCRPTGPPEPPGCRPSAERHRCHGGRQHCQLGPTLYTAVIRRTLSTTLLIQQWRAALQLRQTAHRVLHSFPTVLNGFAKASF